MKYPAAGGDVEAPGDISDDCRQILMILFMLLGYFRQLRTNEGSGIQAKTTYLSSLRTVKMLVHSCRRFAAI